MRPNGGDDPRTTADQADIEAHGLRIEIDQGIATIILDRPAAHNALDRATMRTFALAVDDFTAVMDSDRAATAGGARRSELAAPSPGGIRAIIVTGTGSEAFCSGGDQDDLEHATSESDGAWLTETMGDALRALERLPAPVIAAVEGHALGGGAEIALACDLRIVSERVRFGMVHRRLALIPGWGGGQRLLRLVGYPRAMEILFDARPLDAEELVALGLASEVVPAGQTLAAARALAERLAATDPDTARAIKGLLRDGLEMPHDEALAAERARFPGLWAGQAHLEAVRAFHEGSRRAGRDVGI